MTETLYSLVVMRPLVGQDLSEVRVTSFGKTLPLFFARQRLANLEQPPWNVWFVPVCDTGEIGFIRDIQDFAGGEMGGVATYPSARRS